MISSIAWVPAGIADPRPKKYELSPAEQELILLMEQQGNLDDNDAKRNNKTSKAEKAMSIINASASSAPMAANSLPADLRMDEYSDDDDDEAEMGVGKLLLASDDESDSEMEDDEDDDNEDQQEADDNDAPKRSKYDESDEDDSDDDLNDVPDTREYMALDVEGLEAMGLSQVGGRYTEMQMDELGGEDDESEAADVELSPTDAVLVVGKAEDDFASLEVHVYDRKTGNLYVHHDIPLPAFPLCLAHGQVSSQGKTGNYCAVGTFHPGIEIWNLDVLNALEPSCMLGGEDTTAADDLMQAHALKGSRKQSTKIRNSGLQPGSHTDAVMALSWNPVHQQVIASGSADMMVKLWDVTKASSGDQDGCNAATFSHHKDKVQSVAWHPVEGTLLATGSYDRTVALVDARGSSKDVKIVKLPADCEAIAWDIYNPERLTVASEDGTLSCYDVRQFETSKPLWTFVANQFGVSDISYNRMVPGFLAVSSPDKTITLWDAGVPGSPATTKQPTCCGSKDMCSGKLYALQFYPSDPWLLGTGGSGNQLALWDFSDELEIRKRFNGRLMSPTVEEEQAEVDAPKQAEVEFQAMMSPREPAVTEAPESKTRKGGKEKVRGPGKAHKKRR